MNPHLELDIEELILVGFAPGDRYLIAEALEQQLTRLFSEQGIPPTLTQSGESGRFDGGSFRVEADARPEVIGTQVAQSIYDEFGRIPNHDSQGEQ